MAVVTVQCGKVVKIVQQIETISGGAFFAARAIVLGPVKPLTPPRPISDAKGTLSNERLKAIAKKHHPPQEWYEGEEEQLF